MAKIERMATIQIRKIDHLVLRVRNIEVMRAFYCDVLGAEHVAYRPDFAMSHLRVGDGMLDLVEGEKRGFAAPEGGRLNLDHFCFRVEPFDQEAILAHLKRHNVPIGPVRDRYGAEGNGMSIYLTDPEGNTVELKGPSDGKLPPPPPAG
jgi:catechol 2,3-dioxygenase-like lactoylglutathione lyase family enzyme